MNVTTILLRELATVAKAAAAVAGRAVVDPRFIAAMRARVASLER